MIRVSQAEEPLLVAQWKTLKLFFLVFSSFCLWFALRFFGLFRTFSNASRLRQLLKTVPLFAQWGVTSSRSFIALSRGHSLHCVLSSSFSSSVRIFVITFEETLLLGEIRLLLVEQRSVFFDKNCLPATPEKTFEETIDFQHCSLANSSFLTAGLAATAQLYVYES